ncbi:hypothetical protein F5B20DRAFT_382215 [Whalleya microplaca]|nr:hypothetical protein F5B20DRAFT_382215 [Whalleya microplaca]
MDATTSISGAADGATPLSQHFHTFALQMRIRSFENKLARHNPAASLSKTAKSLEHPKMSPDLPNQCSQVFEDPSFSAWGLIGRHHGVVRKAAERMETIDVGDERIAEGGKDEVEAVEPGLYPLSPLERLPDEVLMQILKYLDNESLYRLSQTTPIFLGLSFDPAFECRPDWRAFRHTVDCLGGGPKKRISEALAVRRRTANTAQKPTGRQTEKTGGLDDEGETMMSFMAREFGIRD